MSRHRSRALAHPLLRARTAALLVLCAATLARSVVAAAPAVGDTMPFRILYGRPTFVTEAGIACYLWSEGGRLHVRLVPSDSRRRVRGELRTSRAGSFRDVTPTSEDLVVKQAKPSKLEFETHTAGKEEGLDVTLAGDFNQLTLDLTIDDARTPDAVRIGARRERPRALPVRLDVKGADPSWIQRFGLYLNRGGTPPSPRGATPSGAPLPALASLGARRRLACTIWCRCERGA
ncbi:hypothetical protein K2Z84_30340 [Candidatus Binatia bacterium]|nr:hypothetical protein [Candidatus Binatia bacterium]